MLKITVPIYYEVEYKTKPNKTVLVGLNWYRNVHFHLNNKVKHFYHELIRTEIGGLKIETPCRPHFNIFLKREGTDGHNVRSIIEKYILDGLVECGAIPDDTPEYISSGSWKCSYDKDNPRCEITFK